MKYQELLEEARARVRALSDSLPALVDPASISLRAKIPYKVVCYREGLIWRAEELARSACDSYGRRDIVAANLLTRGVTETSAAIWHLKELIERQIESGVEDELDTKVMSLLLGHRNNDQMPRAMRVGAFIKTVEKVIPKFSIVYANLSEYAHPNWAGTSFAYSKPDPKEILTRFGRDVRNPEECAVPGLTCLVGSLGIFELAYNKISDMMPDFIGACEADLDRRTANGG